MFDATGSYNEGLILMGGFVALSGLMLYPIPCIRNTLEKVKFIDCLVRMKAYALIKED